MPLVERYSINYQMNLIINIIMNLFCIKILKSRQDNADEIFKTYGFSESACIHTKEDYQILL